MMDFAQKLKDVELHPYLLAIYKDNENLDLYKRALFYWELTVLSKNHYQTAKLNKRHPLQYLKYPPIDQLEKWYDFVEHSLFYNIIQCPKASLWVVDRELDFF